MDNDETLEMIREKREAKIRGQRNMKFSKKRCKRR